VCACVLVLVCLEQITNRRTDCKHKILDKPVPVFRVKPLILGLSPQPPLLKKPDFIFWKTEGLPGDQVIRSSHRRRRVRVKSSQRTESACFLRGRVGGGVCGCPRPLSTRGGHVPVDCCIHAHASIMLPHPLPSFRHTLHTRYPAHSTQLDSVISRAHTAHATHARPFQSFLIICTHADDLLLRILVAQCLVLIGLDLDHHELECVE